MVVMFMAVFLSLGGTVWLFVDDIESTIDFVKHGVKEATVTSPLSPSVISTSPEVLR